MSASEAFTTPMTCTLFVSMTVRVPPSRDFTESALPSTFSIVPRTRCVCGCCAKAGETASAAITAAPASIGRVIPRMSFLPNGTVPSRTVSVRGGPGSAVAR